mmetsp:Transcript_13595/g.29850  ORF Transcript_13595/g.29850 Transcript_13595/m.29850 type:complete len:315 (+) Transcript_13595:94-1038(+)
MEDDDKKFRSKSELEEWLKARGIDEDDVRQAAETLFAHGFNKPSTLWGISSDDLKEVGLSIPVARHFSNKLIIKQAQQQQPHQRGDDDDNILGHGVYEKLTGSVCFFSDEGNKPIGAGFAISKTTVYSVAHNFPNASVGMEISCRFGKPNNHVTRQLQISGLDSRLDYCILKTVRGEAPLPNFLEISRAPLTPGKNCILAAFQIGIQEDLKDLDPDLSVGVFKGEISKLYPRHFVYQCASFAGDSGGAVVLKDGKVVGIHQETVIQARERIQHGEDLDADARLESVEASIDELLRSLSSGSIGLQLSAIPQHEQ